MNRNMFHHLFQPVPSDERIAIINQGLVEGFFRDAPCYQTEMTIGFSGSEMTEKSIKERVIGDLRDIDRRTGNAIGVGGVDALLQRQFAAFPRNVKKSVKEALLPMLSENMTQETALLPMSSGLCEYLGKVSYDYHPRSEWVMLFNPDRSSLINPVFGYNLMEYVEGSVYRLYRIGAAWGSDRVPPAEVLDNSYTILYELVDLVKRWAPTLMVG